MGNLNKCFFALIIAVFTVFAQTESGTFSFSTDTPGYTLHQKDGRRIIQKEIKFTQKYEVRPSVFLSVSTVDVDKNFNKRYQVKAESITRDGFVLTFETWADSKIYAITGGWMSYSKKIEIESIPIEVGRPIKLNNVFFEFNKADLLPESFTELDVVVDYMSKHKTVEIELAGHTDNIGSDDANNKLSQKRAESVKSYIASKGISEARITAKGYGKTKPVADNSTDIGREQNRRVEFTVLKK